MWQFVDCCQLNDVSDKNKVSRICRFYHVVPKDEEKCSQGHYLCATLDCQVKYCKYTTRPLSSSDVKPAIQMMKLHMIGAHPNLKETLENIESCPNNDARKDQRKKEVDPDKNETCPKCYKIFFSKKNVIRHIKTHHNGTGRHSCPDCDKTFASGTAAKYHFMKCHPQESGYKCDICGETCTDFGNFKLHSRKHRPTKMHKCDDCCALFSSKCNLNRHSSEIHNLVNINVNKCSVKSYPYSCDKCTFYTKRKQNLQEHMLKLHSEDHLDLICCDYCPEKFKYRSNMRRHTRRFHEAQSISSEILNELVTNSLT